MRQFMTLISIAQFALVAILVFCAAGLAVFQWQELRALKELDRQMRPEGISLNNQNQFFAYMNTRMRIATAAFDKQRPLQTAMLICMALLLVSFILER